MTDAQAGPGRPGGRRLRRVRELAPEEDVERELRSHLALRTEELVGAGWDLAAARQEAERTFGDYAAVRRACTDVARRQANTRRRARMLSELLQDLRYAWRGVVRNPGFTSLAVLTLALGMGANTAAFSLVNGVLLRPLPYPDPEQLVQLWEVNERGLENAVTFPNFRDWAARSRTVGSMAAYAVYPAAVLGGTEAQRLPVARISSEFFDVLGVRPRLGRTFAAEELREGGAPAVLVSDGYWRRELGARVDLTGVQVRVAGHVASVVGVMPRGFAFPADAQVWLPLELEPASGLGTRSAHNFEVVGRLTAARAAAAAELTEIARSIRAQDPESSATGVAVVPLRDQLVGDSRGALYLLFGASALVLLIACTNMASALLAQSTGRQREIAVRAALGARRQRIVRQLLTENLMLSLLGAAAALAIAWGVLYLVGRYGGDALPRAAAIRLDGWVLAFTGMVAVATTLLSGTAPALRAATPQPYEVIRGGERGGSGVGTARVWSLLIAAEVALALVLLVGAGLLVRSFWNVMNTDPGFAAEGAVLVDIDLPEVSYAGNAERIRYYDALRRDLATVPELRRFGLVSDAPLASVFDPSGRFDVEGGEEGEGNAGYRVISPGYFDALGAKILQGRDVTDMDRPGAVQVAVVNRTLAERYLGESPLGKRLRTGGMDARGDEWVTVVGVVSDVRHRGLMEDARPEYYLPYAQRADRTGNMTLVARGTGRPGTLLGILRERMRGLDANVPLELHTYVERIGEAVADRRFTMLVLAGFAAVALALSAVGIYGVVAYAVARRTREIGIRMALGARAPTVLWMLLRTIMMAVAVGAGLGVSGALLLRRTLQSMLWRVSPGDPLTLAAVVALLVAIAVLAVVVPARRALRVNPVLAIRTE